MLSKYIQYFLDENNLEIGEEFMLTNENGRHIHPDKTFFFNGNPTSSRDILISKDEERFCPNILLGLLTGFYGVQKKPWQPEIGDVYFYVAVDEGRNKGVIHNETLFNKNNIKFLLLKKSGKYYKSHFEAEKHLLFALKSKQTTEWKRKKKPKNMLTNIKRINSLNVLLIGYLKLFPQ